MTPYNRVLLVVGGTAIGVCVATAGIYIQTNEANATLLAQQVDADNAAALGDQLVAQVHEQQNAIGDYLLSGDSASLAQYRQAVVDEDRAAVQIRSEAGTLVGVEQALTGVDAENDAWRAKVAEPAIAAVQSGSPGRIKDAIQLRVLWQASSDVAISRFVVAIDAVAAEFGSRFDALDSLRAAATAVGLLIELMAAGVSMWFVRRYGVTVSRDARRRARGSAERLEIIASLRRLREQATPQETASIVADALARLPGVDVAGVFDCTGDEMIALAVVGMPGFPIRTGEPVPVEHASYLLERSAHGPWAEALFAPTHPDGYHNQLHALGIKSRAFAPIETDGKLIGLIGVATTDEDHARHLVEDLPAVGEFASVAETILAPSLVARHLRAGKRRRIAATIAVSAFRPVFQPVVDLATRHIVGYEALTRFDDGVRPDITFAAAIESGLGIELERATLEAILEAARSLPESAWLSVNVSPALLATADVIGPVLANQSRPLVLEVTEHEAIEAYAPLREALIELGPGVRLAVDDAGAGVANFNHLVELRPNFVKIDAGLVHGVDADPSRRAVVVGLIHFAVESGCQVIAEGIETAPELATLIELGATLGQGYLLGRPAPVEEWIVRHLGARVRPHTPPEAPTASLARSPADHRGRVVIRFR